jgi:hypothetical protein
MKCQHGKCTREARIKNLEYHPDKWLCTFHANKAKTKGRINRKLKRIKNTENETTNSRGMAY